MIETLAEARTEYMRLLTVLTPNQPETILGDFWYTYISRRFDPEDYIFKCVHYGLIGEEIEIELCHYIGGVGPDFFHIWVGPRSNPKDKHKIVCAFMTACTSWNYDDVRLQDVLFRSNIEEFFATIRKQNSII
jgi:hypothetical protein